MKKITLPRDGGGSFTFFLSEHEHFVVESSMKKDKTYLILRGKNNSYLIDLSKEELIQKLSELFFEEKV